MRPILALNTDLFFKKTFLIFLINFVSQKAFCFEGIFNLNLSC